MMALILAVSACLPVEGDQILMRDLAAAVTAFAGQDPQEALGFTPAPGSQRRFSSGELDRLAARKGIAAAMEPVCFERKLEALTQAQILAALREALPEKAQVELIDFSHARVPKGPLEFARSGLTPARASSPRDAVIWRGRVRYSAASSVPVWARVRVWISRPAAMAAQDLPAGKPIQADQVRMESVNGAPFGDSVPMALQDVAGMAPRRTVHAGQAISRAVLAASSDVARGETVGIEAHAGAAFLKYEVRAEASGRVGDSIQVRNLESGKTFRARVVRKGWVAVE